MTEIVGGLALVIGFQTRLAALGLVGFTVAAAFIFHSDLADQNRFIHFMKTFRSLEACCSCTRSAGAA